MAVAAYIDANGIHTPDYSEIRDELKSRWRAIFGEDLYLEPDSQEGEMLDIFSLCLYDAYQFSAATYQAFSPQTAQGAGLSRMVKINGIRRRPATRSYADVRIVGVAGTTITGGIVEDVARQKWNLPASFMIPYEGEILVTATAQTDGAIKAQPGEISTIATPTRGWQSVENPVAAVIGRAVETDAELRMRQTYSTALPSLTVFEGTLGAVANLDNVTRVRGYENDTDDYDSNGIPPHSISLVVDGGDVQEIAKAIYTKKTPGTGTYGDIVVPVDDRYGFSVDIHFFRPSIVTVATQIIIHRLPGYSDEIGERIKENVVAYINSLGIGVSILLSKVFTPINLADTEDIGISQQVITEQKPARFEVTELLLGRDGSALSAQNVSINFKELALIELSNVALILT